MGQALTPRRSWRRCAAAFLMIVALPCAVLACSIPVFRYALERWDPAPYELLMFHRGKLSTEQQRWLAIASNTTGSNAETNQHVVNVAVRTVDLDANPGADALQIWNSQKGLTLPAIVLRNPRGSAVEAPIWSGTLSEAAMRKVIESPARTRLADRLLKGDSAVWLLLESGDRAQDDAAADVLAKRVEHLQKTLKLAEIEAEDMVKYRIAAAAGEMKVAFSVIRVSRKDPAEEVLVRMLLSSEDDLADENEPMAFPVFGRGRALFALVGKGISHETIDEACKFVIGPCSCVVKELNPGQDLLISAPWGTTQRSEPTSDDEVLASAGVVAAKAGTLVPIAPGTIAAAAAAATPAEKPDGRLSRQDMLVAAAGLAVGLGLAGFLVKRRSKTIWR